jgi:hypothetical protein
MFKQNNFLKAHTMTRLPAHRYCDIEIADKLAKLCFNAVYTRQDIAKLVKALRKFGYNSATLYEASFKMQQNAGLSEPHRPING